MTSASVTSARRSPSRRIVEPPPGDTRRRASACPARAKAPATEGRREGAFRRCSRSVRTARTCSRTGLTIHEAARRDRRRCGGRTPPSPASPTTSMSSTMATMTASTGLFVVSSVWRALLPWVTRTVSPTPAPTASTATTKLSRGLRSGLRARTISHFIPPTLGSLRVAQTVPMTRPRSMDFQPRSGYSNARVHQVNATASTRATSSVLADLARACALVLAAFCVLEAALPRAGRAAAGFLLRHDSSFLRGVESVGSRVESLAADGILAAALAALVTTALAASLHPNARYARAGGRRAPAGVRAACVDVRDRRGVDRLPVSVRPRRRVVAPRRLPARRHRGDRVADARPGRDRSRRDPDRDRGPRRLDAAARGRIGRRRLGPARVRDPRARGVAAAGLAWSSRRPRLLTLLAAAVFARPAPWRGRTRRRCRRSCGTSSASGTAGLHPAWTAGLAAAALAGLVCAVRAPSALPRSS